MTINMNVTDDDLKLIQRVAERGASIRAWANRGFSVVDCEMVVAVTHLNGCPLNLQQLLDSEQADFTHDIFGMLQHINRDTGGLDDFFEPRCALTTGEESDL